MCACVCCLVEFNPVNETPKYIQSKLEKPLQKLFVYPAVFRTSSSLVTTKGDEKKVA